MERSSGTYNTRDDWTACSVTDVKQGKGAISRIRIDKINIQKVENHKM